jgi:hypothetical protein
LRLHVAFRESKGLKPGFYFMGRVEPGAFKPWVSWVSGLRV